MDSRFSVEAASLRHLEFLLEHDWHISREMLLRKVEADEVLVALALGEPIGYLRWSLFWDSIPFLNLLFLLEEWRGKGSGRVLIESWLSGMRNAGHRLVMTSSQSDEPAQGFYRHLGFRDAGSLVLPREPLEVLFIRSLDQ